MSLLSVGVHRRRGQGCYFHADEGECTLGFPQFALSIDDKEDCTLPYGTMDPAQQYTYDECGESPTQKLPRKSLSRSSKRVGPSTNDLDRPLLSFKVQTRSQTKQQEQDENVPLTQNQLPTPTTNTKSHTSTPLGTDLDNFLDKLDLWEVPVAEDCEWDACSIDSDEDHLQEWVHDSEEMEHPVIKESGPNASGSINNPVTDTSGKAAT